MHKIISQPTSCAIYICNSITSLWKFWLKFYHPTTSLPRNLFVMQGNSWNCTTKYTKWTRCCFSQRKAGKVYIFISEGNSILWFLKHVSKYLEMWDKTTYRAHVCKFFLTDGLNRKLQIPFCLINIMLRPSRLPGVTIQE